MDNFILSINIILILLIINYFFNKKYVTEGLAGCPANTRQSGEKNEINSNVSSLNAKIAMLNLRVIMATSIATVNRKELEKVSDAARQKAEETKQKLDEIKRK
jgi:outer membrane murein-binding lipoprotein Lpp